jgi:hypothetical protein
MTSARIEIDGRPVSVEFDVKAVRRLVEGGVLMAAIDYGADQIVNL